MKNFKRILVANRGEIAIRIFRACKELGIRSVAIYTEEDKNSLFRTKSDEAYQIGRNKGPVTAYLDIEEIISLAVKKGVDAIHPGYGFLSENPEFAEKCHQAGIVFIGPTADMMRALGDKIASKKVAESVGVPTIPGITRAIASNDEAIEFARYAGYPVMLKAAAGGGGRGMRIVRSEEELLKAYSNARNESLKAFGSEDIFIEKYLEKPKHIEVQVLGDGEGNLVHLYERDCSIQRRHQKLIEFSPALALTQEKREEICQDALKIAGSVQYQSAGTVEFLVDKDNNHYFIEMNPRIQVEHTVTEMTTGIDIVQSQILIAQGHTLSSDEIGIRSQEDIVPRGFAIQCRITTENPGNDFMPDTGRIDVYRTSSGAGIRLDGGNGFTGAVVSPYYDSLLVKSTSWSRHFQDAINKNIRAIKETRIEGVKTNSDFLINVLNHPTFRRGECDTNFIQDNPDLFDLSARTSHELQVLNYIADKVVNETGGFKRDYDVPKVPITPSVEGLVGTKQILDREGPEGLVRWIRDQKKLLISDTTMRDAHQSLMATRMRTKDMKKIARATSYIGRDFFSLEMWGGATFDVSYRFLKESPWERLDLIRERVPNVLLQMLLRGSNGVGYKNYPDNVIRELIRESADRGIDVFRIFDSLNWLQGMDVAIDEVLKTGKVAEGAICYTGDILDETRDKYSLKYYVDKAKELEKRGIHILSIKDMSGLLKPYAAHKLVSALKDEIGIPLHMHTHDTTGNGVASMLLAAQAGADIVDTAINSMSGLTSQPAMSSVVEAVRNTERDTGISSEELQKLNDYWANVRPVYEKFESDLKSSAVEIYKYEIPGGQYSNLKPQVESFGLGHRFDEVKEMFRSVNIMLGDIVKVTPSSKAVGDMAIFMVQNGLTPENIMDKGGDLTYPDSIFAYFKGMMGQPEGGFPEDLQRLVLKGEEPITVRPGTLLPPEDFDGIGGYLKKSYGRDFDRSERVSYALYPKVYEDYLEYLEKQGDFTEMGSDVYFHGLKEGETCEVKITSGKRLVITLNEIGRVGEDGMRTVVFEVDGNRREIRIKDKEALRRESVDSVLMKDEDDPYQVGASIPGNISKILVGTGDLVKAGQPLLVVEAMKMETEIAASMDGVVERIHAKELETVAAGQLLMELKAK